MLSLLLASLAVAVHVFVSVLKVINSIMNHREMVLGTPEDHALQVYADVRKEKSWLLASLSAAELQSGCLSFPMQAAIQLSYHCQVLK